MGEYEGGGVCASQDCLQREYLMGLSDRKKAALGLVR